MQTENRRIVLMADDDEDDCYLAGEALKATGAEVAFASVADGVQLMRYLSERSRSALTRLPHLLLLDLKMPRKDGRAALLEIKAQPALRQIPIVILTTSEEEADLSFSMRAGAKSFITKPASFDGWIRIMKSLSELWLAK